jgi:glycosyltransferase involved in cell wall biosynthesis
MFINRWERSMTKLKIAIWHNLPSGGGKRALYYHVRGLIERGHTVESWCPSTADRTYLPLDGLIKEHIIPFDWEPKSSKTRVGAVLNNFANTTSRITAMDEHCQQCADEINAGDFDILLVNPCGFFRTSAIGHYIQIPKVLYLQEPYRSLYEAIPRLPWLALPDSTKHLWQSPRDIYRFISNLVYVQTLRVQAREELKNAQAFDLILVNSLFSRESVQRAYGLDSKVCYLGVDSKLFEPLHLPRQNIVVGLGGIAPGKGLDRAVRAIGSIIEIERPSLVWVGNFSDPNYLNEIERLASSLEVNFVQKVRISDRELVILLNQASVMIYTSILEPFGFAPLEANACETPVVAIAEGGIRETLQDGVNGFLINDNNPIEIGQAISKLINDPTLAREIGESARNIVIERWSLDNAINNIENILASEIEFTRKNK